MARITNLVYIKRPSLFLPPRIFSMQLGRFLFAAMKSTITSRSHVEFARHDSSTR